MKKDKDPPAEDDLLPEYDFTGAVRGKYYERFRQSSNVVVLDPDVSKTFPNAESVNAALRALASVARRTSHPARRPYKRRQLRTSAKRKPRGHRR